MSKAGSSSSSLHPTGEESYGGDNYDEMQVDGSESGWVEARTRCDHVDSLSPDLAHIPTPDTHCSGCEHPKENWLCLTCKDVLCSRFVNKHMLHHYHSKNHPLALSFSDLSIWCFSCDSYLDVQAILSLRPVYETAYILKFGEAPPFRTVVELQGTGGSANPASSS